MDSILMKLNRSQNKWTLKLMLVLMAVCMLTPLGSSAVAAEDEPAYNGAEYSGETGDAADDAASDDGYVADAPVNSVTTVYTPQEILEEHVKYIYGYPDGTVKPDEGVTRAEAAVIYYRLLGGNENGSISTFTDLRGDEWYYQSVAYLERNGIIYGYPDGTFRPNERISRAEYAAMVVRLLDLAPVDTNVFDDVAGHWAVGYINSAASEGWISGNGYGQFQPDLTITRAQIVTIINRIMNREIRAENIPVDAQAYSDLSKTHWAYCAIIEASDTHEFDRTEDNTEVWRDRMLGL